MKALLITAAIIAPAIGIAVAGRLTCYALERLFARLARRGQAPRAGSDLRTEGSAASPRTSAARALSETERRDEALRREACGVSRSTGYQPPGVLP